MKKKKKIRRKITELLLFMVLGAIFLIGGVSIFSLYSMKNASEKSSMELGQTAAMDAEEALEKMAGEQLLGLAVQKTEYIEEKFNTVIGCVNGIAQEAEVIYANPDSYPDREVALPVKGSRELAAQLLWSKRLTGVRDDGISAGVDTGLVNEIRKLGNIQDLLVQYNKNNDMISSTYIATQSGWMIQADYIAYSKFSDNSDDADFYEAGERQWYQRALSAPEGKTVYSDVMVDIHEGRDCIVCSRAVYADGEIVAVAGVGSYLDTVNDAVLDTEIGEKGYAFLVNEKGQVMVSGAADGETAASANGSISLLESNNKELAKAAEAMVSGETTLSKLTVDDREVYMAFAPLYGLGWSFVTVMDVEEVIAPARQSQQGILELTDMVSKQQNISIRRTLLLFLLIVLAATVLISFASIVFARKITAPIRKLSMEVEQIDGGNLDKKIEISTGDEVEELGKAFNGMTAQINSYIGNLAAATAEKERIRTELDLASQIQADMLPDSDSMFADSEKFSLSAKMTPAKEVGGDFYDFFLIDDENLAFMAADVSGKGVPASLFMVVARTLLHTRIKSGEMLAEAVTKVNDSLCAVNKNGMFVTAWIGILNIPTGVLTYVNAGHNPPLIGNKKDGYVYLKERSGFVLAGMENIIYTQKEIRLKSEDTIFLYTDGVTEANNEEGKLYGEERLQTLLNNAKEVKAELVMDNVWNEVQKFQGEAEQFDDITMLAINYHGDTDKVKSSELTGEAEICRMQEVQDFLEDFLQKVYVPKKYIRQMLIVADEIFSNICHYSKASEVKVECRFEDNEVTLSFEDDGMAFNPLDRAKPDVDEPMEQRKTGGLGIYMVCEMMDEVTYIHKNEKNRLSIMKHLD